jgi:hypothetical protein
MRRAIDGCLQRELELYSRSVPNPEQFLDLAPRLAPPDEYDQVDASPYIVFGHLKCEIGAVPDCQRRQAAYGFSRAAAMDGRQRSAMAGVHRVQQCASLRPAHLTDDNPVWPVPEYSFEQVVESDFAAMRIGL